MIPLTRMNGVGFVLNAELIKAIESTPDTVVTLLSGEKWMVRESVDEVVDLTVKYRQRIYRDPPQATRENQGGLTN